MKYILICCSIVLLLVSGCASSIQGLQIGAAGSIGSGIKPNDIEVSNVNRGAMNVNWTATTPDRSAYSCSADDMVRRVNCN